MRFGIIIFQQRAKLQLYMEYKVHERPQNAPKQSKRPKIYLFETGIVPYGATQNLLGRFVNLPKVRYYQFWIK